jgi:hypothetical protein
MKFKLFLIVTMLACAGRLAAQTNTVTVPTFFNSVMTYLTSFNTNYTFQGVTFESDTGYKQVTGVGAASVLDMQYDIDKFHIATSLQFSGVGSAFNAEEGGAGYDLIQYYDTALEANLLGGYDETVHSGVIDPGLDIKKKMTPNTFTEIGIALPVYFKEKFNSTPTFKIAAGFTF